MNNKITVAWSDGSEATCGADGVWKSPNDALAERLNGLNQTMGAETEAEHPYLHVAYHLTDAENVAFRYESDVRTFTVQNAKEWKRTATQPPTTAGPLPLPPLEPLPDPVIAPAPTTEKGAKELVSQIEKLQDALAASLVESERLDRLEKQLNEEQQKMLEEYDFENEKAANRLARVRLDLDMMPRGRQIAFAKQKAAAITLVRETERLSSAARSLAQLEIAEIHRKVCEMLRPWFPVFQSRDSALQAAERAPAIQFILNRQTPNTVNAQMIAQNIGNRRFDHERDQTNFYTHDLQSVNGFANAVIALVTSYFKAGRTFITKEFGK